VCERWNGFTNFLNDILASIGERPPGRLLDRIDNNGNYEPGNVRWLPPGESNKNRRPLKAYRNSLSGIKGVRQRHGRWQAQIGRDGRTYPLGTFDTPEEAAEAYQAALQTLAAGDSQPLPADLSQRIRAGIDRAKSKGKRLGRPPLDPGLKNLSV
jgi:hypothetical protein